MGTLSLLLLLPLMPRPKLTPGMDTMVDTTVDFMVDTMATPTPTMARGLLMPRLPLFPKLAPRLTLIFFMEATTDLDIIMEASTVAMVVMATAMATTGASKKGTDPIEN